MGRLRPIQWVQNLVSRMAGMSRERLFSGAASNICLLWVQDALPGWDNPSDLRTPGLYRMAGSLGAQTPRVNLIRFHGVFAPNSKQRVRNTPAKRRKGREQAKAAASSWLEKTPEERYREMAVFVLAKPSYMPSMAIA